ncbi:C-type lectin-like [Erythrolamprus reginae]|uniref:C-type lectin-like n=1 Tax=Erythrolamprus reginae TaxID=121349 RepID=UPI00396C9A27
MGFTSFHVSFLGFLVASFFIQGLEAKTCPKDWFEHEQSCYKFFPGRKAWHEAEAHCKSFDQSAHLASVHTERAMDMISSVICASHSGSGVWIGLYKLRGKELRMRWTDRTPVHYLPWAPKEPSGAKDKENCVELYAHDYTIWNDHHCDLEKPYVCKFILHEILMDAPGRLLGVAHSKMKQILVLKAKSYMLSDLQVECQQYGLNAHLASIISKMEQEMIASHITNNYKIRKGVWIGLYDSCLLSGTIYPEEVYCLTLLAFQKAVKTWLF